MTFKQKTDKAFIYGSLRATNKLLLDPYFGPFGLDKYAICTASEYGHLRVVNRLLQDPRVDPSVYANMAISMAVWNGHIAVVERLLQDPRVDPSDNMSIDQFSDRSLFILVNALKYPFPKNSYISEWEPRLLEYVRDFRIMIEERTTYDIWKYIISMYLE